MIENNMGFLRVCCASLDGTPADVESNAERIKDIIHEANAVGAGIILFPPLALTQTGCGNLFYQKQLYNKQAEALMDIAETFADTEITAVIGCFEKHASSIYDSYAVIQKGDVICGTDDMVLRDDENDLLIGFDDTCHIQFITSDDEITVGQSAYIRELVKVKSGQNKNIVMFSSASGILAIAENGKLLAFSDPFSDEDFIVYDVDTQLVEYHRLSDDSIDDEGIDLSEAEPIEPIRMWNGDMLIREISPTPFKPDTLEELYANCREIFEIQSSALAKRLYLTHSTKSVVGISGGLDSTLALLVSLYAHKKLGFPAENIIAVTMPGFGTTGRTYENALSMMKSTGATVREISIVPSVTQHFKDIGHDINDHSVTYENAQARERTQILMDIANKEGGLVIGTGDLSEEALGWCTFNGDHISMYGVNAGVPKTVIQYIIRWFIDVKLKEDNEFANDNNTLAKTLEDILSTPISPELLPPDESGNIAQKTEEKVGPYELHDFFIYHTVRNGIPPEKLLFMAECAFKGKYDNEFIRSWLQLFYKRFFTQQFKRSCSPDSPKIGTVDLSPAHWNMPSDASFNSWIDEF